MSLKYEADSKWKPSFVVLKMIISASSLLFYEGFKTSKKFVPSTAYTIILHLGRKMPVVLLSETNMGQLTIGNMFTYDQLGHWFTPTNLICGLYIFSPQWENCCIWSCNPMFIDLYIDIFISSLHVLVINSWHVFSKSYADL